MTKQLEVLINMHSPRPYKTKSVERWTNRWIKSLPGNKLYDDAGNTWIFVGESDTVFACHTDTVHRDEAPFSTVMYNGKLVAHQDLQACVLGADDTAGAYVMRRMVLANKPGVYIFHVGEECGGIGSSYINEKYDMSQYKRVVSFDRRGTGSVITHQWSGRTASQAFADELCDRLGQQGLPYDPDATGSFTDSANYADQVPECTNISVGYSKEHTVYESLDVEHVMALTEAAIAIDWDDLPAERDPAVIDPDDFDDWNWRTWNTKGTTYQTYKGDSVTQQDIRHMSDKVAEEIFRVDTWDDLKWLCEKDPERIAAFLAVELGITLEDVLK